MQKATVAAALELIDVASGPVVLESALEWDSSEDWKDNFMKIDDSNRAELQQMGEENRRRRQELKEAGLRRS